MEEAAQMLEIETLIPMLLQDVDPLYGSRLKRVVLLGDHHQLPPVVKHAALQKFSRLDQSLFTRFIRLGVPAIQLDKQGRARPEIAALYSWRYSSSATGANRGSPSSLSNSSAVSISLRAFISFRCGLGGSTASAGLCANSCHLTAWRHALRNNR